MVAFSCVIVTSSLAQTSGGPDAFGYIWKNNAEPGGPAYVWKDIKGIGTQITGLADDNSKSNIALNWNFRYYWSDYNKITVGSNGWIGFTGSPANIAAPFPTLPSATAKNTICPLLADLTFTQANSSPVPGATAWYWTNNQDTMIVQYDSVPYWVNTTSGYAGRYTFQVILSGADSSITFQYKSCVAGTPSYTSSEGSATGICNSTGTIGLQVLPSLTFPTSQTAVKFYYPKPVTYQVFDVTPRWNHNVKNGGFFVAGPYGNPISLTTDLFNSGNQPVGPFNVTGTLYDASLNPVWSSNASCNGLAPGADTIVTYPATYAANTIGTFIYRSTTTLSTDMNPGNNTNDVEMVVVDTSQAIFSLAYTEATTTSSGLSWQGGGAGSGAGVYFEPPFYPATVVSLDYYITGGTGGGGFTATILDDDGPNGDPGTQLFSIVQPTATIGSYNNVMLSSPITVTSGGIYVAWLMSPDTTGVIGTDGTLPLSNRNYEIIGGNWAEYRNNSTEDVMIKVNITGSNTTGMPASEAVFNVTQNYPNPADNYTTIHFSLPSSGEIIFSIKNMIGQQVESVNLGIQHAGSHVLKVNTSKFTNGIYFYTIKFGDKEITKKMIVTR